MSGDPTYVIAEAGVNHNGSLELAHKLIDVAKEAGADAVKFQTFTIDSVVSPHTPMAAYQKENTGGKGTMAEMLQGLDLPLEAFAELATHCDTVGVDFLSTAFDVESLRYLDRLGMKYVKSPSGEITNPDLLKAYGSLGKPVILSTGMATLGEVEQALDWISAAGATAISVLHCVSDYPAAPDAANLRAMVAMGQAFQRPFGWSDHTLGDGVSVAAVALGARIIEKHFTLDVDLPGPDHKASLDPRQLAGMIERIRMVEVALGDGRKRPTERELAVRDVARRSLVTVRPIAQGAMIVAEDIAALRPGTGIEPRHRETVVGRRAAVDLAPGTVLQWGQLL